MLLDLNNKRLLHSWNQEPATQEPPPTKPDVVVTRASSFSCWGGQKPPSSEANPIQGRTTWPWILMTMSRAPLPSVLETHYSIAQQAPELPHFQKNSALPVAAKKITLLLNSSPSLHQALQQRTLSIPPPRYSSSASHANHTHDPKPTTKSLLPAAMIMKFHRRNRRRSARNMRTCRSHRTQEANCAKPACSLAEEKPGSDTKQHPQLGLGFKD